MLEGRHKVGVREIGCAPPCVEGEAVLQKLGDYAAKCLARAADAERCAADPPDNPLRSDYEKMAQGWRRLASSYQFVESLEQFLAGNKNRWATRPSAPRMEIPDEYTEVGVRTDDAHQRAANRWMHLAREAEHRTKNVLATVLATIDLSSSVTPQGLKRAIKGRIQALANVQALFVQSRWMGAELSHLAMQELAPYVQGDDVRAHIDGPRLLLEPETAQTMAMALHELATNAARYGALSVATGHVEVKWSVAAGGSIVVRWTESGGPPVNPPARRGFGTEMMEGRIRYQAGGDVRWDWRQAGLTCEIVLNADAACATAGNTE